MHGLGEIIIRPQIQAGQPRLSLGLTRQDDDRRLVAIFPQFVQNIASGHIRQAEIQNNGLIIVNIGQFNAGFTAFGLIDLNILSSRISFKALENTASSSINRIRMENSHKKR
jgi:hypothetical protein